jgi:hypothetical protein
LCGNDCTPQAVETQLGYDFHVIRTRDWLDAARTPITKRDVDALVATDPELEWSSSSWVDMSDNAGVMTRYSLIEWNGKPCFWWYRDQIICSSPREEQQKKLIKIAHALKAFVVGDECELYEIKRNIFGKETIAFTPQKC